MFLIFLSAKLRKLFDVVDTYTLSYSVISFYSINRC